MSLLRTGSRLTYSMPIFRSTIDPFSSYTINVGPLYVERVFDFLLTKQGIGSVHRLNDRERWTLCLEYLKKKANMSRRNQYAVIQFYKGHFYQQLATCVREVKNVHHLQEKALCYYQLYLELSPRQDESKYYAQWQAGVLEDSLRYPWLLVENSLLKAAATDPARGEAIKKIVGHYIRSRDWDGAYHYSSIAISQYFDKNPVATRRWFIDFSAYDYAVIRAHRFICDKLGFVKEKNPSNGTANSQTITQPGQL